MADRQCPNCGELTPENARFCGHCGANLPPPAKQDSGRTGTVLTVVLALLLLIMLMAACAAGSWFILKPQLEERLAASNSERRSTSDGREGDEVEEPEPALKNSPVPGETTNHEDTSDVASNPQASPTEDAGVADPTIAIATRAIDPTPLPSPTDMATPVPEIDPGPEHLAIGESINGAPIEVVRFGNGPINILFIGGLHAGFAPSSVTTAQRAIDYFSQHPDEIHDQLTLTILISANPDSRYAPGEFAGRLNMNDVDLNRNWGCRWREDATWRGDPVPGLGGSAPFSEPETKALSDYILALQPSAVIFWEARAVGGLSSPGGCGPSSQVSQPLAQTYGVAAGYRVAVFEELTNQVIYGDGTNWLDQQGIPSISVLLPEYAGIDWDNTLSGMKAVLNEYGG